MSQLNYHHLRYFWVVAREGTITRAADLMGVTQPTISAQISALEESLGVDLFRRRGNRLMLTETGRVVQEHASTIFSTGERLLEVARNGNGSHPTRFAVGVTDSVPLLSAHRLLRPALEDDDPELRILLRVDTRERLLAALAARTLDFVLADEAVGPSEAVDASAHPVAQSQASIFGAPSLVRRLTGPFPESLHEAPFVLHTENTPLRRGLDGWFARHGIRPRVAAEVGAVGFLQLLGQDGLGFFVAPAFVEEEICGRYGVEVVGRAEGVVERFFGITLRGRPTHVAVRRLLSTR